MAERDSWAVMNGATRVVDAEDARIALGAFLQPGATVLGKQTGIFNGPGTPGAVTATSPTPDINVKVSAFQMAVPASRGAGAYIATLDADKTLNVLGTDPADPSNPRRDLIIARQTDTYYADGSTAFTVLRIKGVASGSPVDPDPTQGGLYPDYHPMARVRVAAGATSITNAMIDPLQPPRIVALGGIIPVSTVAERNALPAIPGLTVYRRDKNWFEVYNSTAAAWHCIGLVTTGALADITNPYTGQLALLSTTNLLYRRTGASWVIVAELSGSTPSGDWEISGDQALGTAVATLLTWPVTNQTPVGITSVGGVQTVQVAGWWAISLSIRFSAAGGNYGLICGTSATNAFGKDSTSVFNTNTSVVKKLAVGDSFRCYGYCGSGGNATKENVGDDVTGMSAVWLGP